VEKKKKPAEKYYVGGLGVRVLLAENHMGMEQQHSTCSKTTGEMLR
jgi:hypothetical protein